MVNAEHKAIDQRLSEALQTVHPSLEF